MELFMKTRTKFFLTSACLIFMEYSAYAMHLEKERDLSPTRSKIQELNQKNDGMKTLGSSSRWLEGGKISFLPSKNILLNEQSHAADVPDRNLASQAMDDLYTEVFPNNIVI